MKKTWVNFWTFYIKSPETDINRIEGTGALNFLAIDDLPIKDEGEEINPASILSLEFKDGRPVFPKIEPLPDDPFLKKVQASGEKWVICVDDQKPKVGWRLRHSG